MTPIKYTLFFISMLALTAQAQARNAGWLLLGTHDADNPYTFLGVADENAEKSGKQISLPSNTYSGWSVFNAPNAALETSSEYDISAADDSDNVGDGMLRFNSNIDDEQTFLALGIRAKDDGTQLLMDATKGMVRADNVYAEVRFVECADLPDVDTLKKMYPSYADSLPTEYGEAIYTAAKLGVCVGPDGYFYVARVRAGTTLDTTTGLPEDYLYEFCQSPISYNAVGGGKVVIRIEFNTYLSADETLWRRAFRIFAKNADANADANAEEKCLTTGLGYPWKISDAGDEYQFDFQSLGQGEWLYAIDDAVAAGGDMNLDYNALDALNRLAFSATAGGFYSAWLSSGSAQNLVALASYDAKQFAPYIAEPNGVLYSLYTDWAAKYNVALTDYLEPATGGISLYGAESTDLTQKAFDAFLLYMDPETNEPLRLTVTGIVPEEDQVSFTVMGPEGCNLREAVTRAARLRIRRAATLADFAEAPAEEYDIAFSSDGTSASFVLPKVDGEVEMPFMQATLVPVTDIK
jgi:hypothetical protein